MADHIYYVTHFDRHGGYPRKASLGMQGAEWPFCQFGCQTLQDKHHYHGCMVSVASKRPAVGSSELARRLRPLFTDREDAKLLLTDYVTTLTKRHKTRSQRHCCFAKPRLLLRQQPARKFLPAGSRSRHKTKEEVVPTVMAPSGRGA